jgi:hypothetical protein
MSVKTVCMRPSIEEQKGTWKWNLEGTKNHKVRKCKTAKDSSLTMQRYNSSMRVIWTTSKSQGSNVTTVLEPKQRSIKSCTLTEENVWTRYETRKGHVHCRGGKAYLCLQAYRYVTWLICRGRVAHARLRNLCPGKVRVQVGNISTRRLICGSRRGRQVRFLSAQRPDLDELHPRPMRK